jgi:hypothetical protein
MSKDECRKEILKIGNYYKDSNEHIIQNLNAAIKELSVEINNKNNHFILELIQNAEDNNYEGIQKPLISFHLTMKDPTKTENSNGALIIKNNENGFSYVNVVAICSVARSTKKKKDGYIGEKGIGFKSVFEITTCPHIVSNGYYFSLPEKDEETGFGYIVPKWWDNPGEYENFGGTTIILPLDKQEFNYEKIEKMLENIEPMTILFLSKIKEIKIKTDSGDNFSIVKDDSKKPEVQLYINGEKRGKMFENGPRNFMWFSDIFERPKEIIQENRKDIEEREVTIAYPLDHENEVSGRVFAYLPTDFNSNFPFVINADFILTSGRSEIKGINEKDDCPWNAWLWECIATLTADSLETLAERHLLTVERLNMLVSPLNNIEKNNVLYPFFLKIKSAFIEQKLLETDTGFSCSGDALLLRSSELLELFNNQTITSQLFKRKHWLNKKITRNSKQLIDLFYFLYDKDKLAIPEIDFSDFLDKISHAFLVQQSDEWMINFYSILKKLSSSIIINKAKTKPIIRAIKSGEQVQIMPFINNEPNVYICHDPNIAISSSIIKPEIIQNNDLETFFKDVLHIPEWKDTENIITNIIPKYTESREIPLVEHLQDIQKIYDAYNKKGSENDKQRLKTKLINTPFILTENINGKNIGYKKPTEIYIRNENLKVYFAFNEKAAFISSSYNDSIFNMLKELGVENNVRVKFNNKCDYQGNIIIRDYFGWHWRGLNNYDPDISIDGLQENLDVFRKIDNFDSADREKILLFSKFLWNNIAVKHSNCISGLIEKSSNQNYTNSKKINDTSKFGRLLIDTPWLPNRENEFHRPPELKFSDLPNDFQNDPRLIRMLGMKQDLIAQLAAQTGIPAEDLEFIKRNSEDFKRWKIEMAQVSFPDKLSNNPELREQRIKDTAEKEAKRTKRIMPRSVTITEDEKSRARSYLLYNYKDDYEIMRCQICGENHSDLRESPFKTTDDGKWHFESYPFLLSLREKLHRANFLALCHNHAAMFSLIDDDEIKRIENLILKRKKDEERFIEIDLIGQKRKIWFTHDHINEIKSLLEKHFNPDE